MKSIFKIIFINILPLILALFSMLFLVYSGLIFKINPSILILGIFSIALLTITFFIIMNTKSKNKYKSYISLEKIPIEFEKIYNDLYVNHIHSLEKIRKQVRWRTILQYICIILFGITSISQVSTYSSISKVFNSNVHIIGMIFLFISIIIMILNRKHKKQYIKTYKQEIIPNFIKLISNDLKYKNMTSNYQSMISDILSIKSSYKEAAFDNNFYNSFYPDDYIEGFIDNEIFVKMCDLHIQYSSEDGASAKIFQGIFSYTNSKKDIGTYIKISKNKIKILDKKDRIQMDSEEFEKYFDIYSENKIVTMQLLTSDIMQCLIDFHNQYSLDYEIVFRNDTIYMRFFTGAMFEPKIFSNSMDKQTLFMYFSMIKFIAEVTKKINTTLLELEL